MIWWTRPWNPIVGCEKCSPACFDEWVTDKLARLRGLLEADHV